MRDSPKDTLWSGWCVHHHCLFHAQGLSHPETQDAGKHSQTTGFTHKQAETHICGTHIELLAQLLFKDVYA